MSRHTCNRCLAIIETIDGSPLGTFCGFCCQQGELLYAQDDLHKFRRRYFNKMHAEGANKFVARFHTLMIGQAPYWQSRR